VFIFDIYVGKLTVPQLVACIVGWLLRQELVRI